MSDTQHISLEQHNALVWQSILNLDRWLTENGWTGYDPYDILGTKFFQRVLQKSRNGSTSWSHLRRIILASERRYPLMMRRLFQVHPQINAKGMGLFAKAYSKLYQVTNDDNYRQRAETCLDWLRSNPATGYAGLGWGYPFDWQSKIFIPRGTPSAVVSSVVGDAFWEAYKTFQEGKFLQICERICEFFISGLNIDEVDAQTICFSYTPLDDFHVHNANLFVAEYLVRVGTELQRTDFIELGCKAANYALQEQNSDGSLYYWGKVQNHYSPDHLDHYHSGFEIRMFYGLWQTTRDDLYRDALKRYYQFYAEEFFIREHNQIKPKMTPTAFYPVNIHSCAEAILCNATLVEEFEQARLLLPGLIEWIIPTMQTEAGWFIYMIWQKDQQERRVEIPYMRWGQAWMLLALSQYLHVASKPV